LSPTLRQLLPKRAHLRQPPPWPTRQPWQPIIERARADCETQYSYQTERIQLSYFIAFQHLLQLRYLHLYCAPMKFILFFLLAISVNLRAYAQQAPSILMSTPEMMNKAQIDTLHAVQHLFSTRRNGGRLILISSLVSSAVFLSIYTGLQSWGRTKEDYSLSTIGGVVAIGVAPSVLGGNKISRYSVKREKMVLKSYEQGNALPADIRKQLQRRDFIADSDR
jgi:hypothetical protein